MPVLYLRRIVLLEACAKEKVRICGLWRSQVKGLGGATPRPGSMTEYICEQRPLPAEEIQWVIDVAVPSLRA